jgi:outer membrane protein assembly factor BamA
MRYQQTGHKILSVKRTICYCIAAIFFSANVVAQQADTVAKKKSLLQRSSIAPLPIIAYNRSFGLTGGLLVNAFTKIKPSDSISPASRTTIGAGYTQNKSWVLLASQMLFLKNDRWRINWTLGLGSINFQYLDELGEAGNAVFVKYQTRGNFFASTILYKVGGRFFTGIKYQYSETSTIFDNESRPSDTTTLVSFGIPVTFDTRDFVYYPQKGVNANIQFNTHAKWLGSEEDFNAITAHCNFFKRLTPKGILAARFYTYAGLGSVPFVGQKAVGGKDLRGYTKGQYRGNVLSAVQTEYRLALYKKWGMVAFAGAAIAGGIDNTDFSGLLPAAGAGLRYTLIPRQKINIGAEVAVGKNDWGFYFRIGETF